MSIGEAKERRDLLRLNVLAHREVIAKMNHDYHQSGINGDLKTRKNLEWEIAKALYEINALDQYIHANRKADEALKRAEFSAVIIRLLMSLGMGELVRRAQRVAQDSTKAAMDMYQPMPVITVPA